MLYEAVIEKHQENAPTAILIDVDALHPLSRKNHEGFLQLVTAGFRPLPSIVAIGVAKQLLEIPPTIEHAVDRNDMGCHIDREGDRHALGVTFSAKLWTNVIALCASLWKRGGDDTADIFVSSRFSTSIRNVGIQNIELALRVWREYDRVMLHQLPGFARRAR